MRAVVLIGIVSLYTYHRLWPFEQRLADGCLAQPHYAGGLVWWGLGTVSWLLGVGCCLETGRGLQRVFSTLIGIGLFVCGLWGTAHAFGLMFFDVTPCIPFLSFWPR
jgi:hypothetical protein